MQKSSHNSLSVRFFRPMVNLLKRSEALSALACRLTKLTHKHSQPIHPKHLIHIRLPWFYPYIQRKSIILDIGCHNGQRTLKAALRCKKICGFDYDQNALDMAQQEAERLSITNVKFAYGNAEEKLGFKAKAFDTVLLLDVLEHLHRRTHVLKEVYRVLKPGGWLCLSIPNADTSWKRLQKSLGLFYYSDPDHKIEFTKQKIVRLLIKVGFQVVDVASVTLDTPFVGFIDVVGGISLTAYTLLSRWRRNAVLVHPEESVGWEIAAQKPIVYVSSRLGVPPSITNSRQICQ